MIVISEYGEGACKVFVIGTESKDYVLMMLENDQLAILPSIDEFQSGLEGKMLPRDDEIIMFPWLNQLQSGFPEKVIELLNPCIQHAKEYIDIKIDDLKFELLRNSRGLVKRYKQLKSLSKHILIHDYGAI